MAMKLTESQAAAHALALAAGLLPVEEWRAVLYSPEETKPDGNTLWLGDLVDSKPHYIGYYLFRRDVGLYSPPMDEDPSRAEYFGKPVYCVRWAQCHHKFPWQMNWYEELAAENTLEKAKAVALAHRSSPAGWLVPDEQKQPHTKDLGWWSKVDYPWDCCVGDEAYWSGYVSPDGQPIGAGWYIRRNTINDPFPFKVHWMCGQGDLLPHLRNPMKKCRMLGEAKAFTNQCRDVLLPGSGATEWQMAEWQARMER